MRTCFICCSYLPFILLSFCVQHGSAGTACKIKKGKADCSHLKLKAIPSDLPTNITTLDISHNQLKTLPPANLTKYSQLVYLDSGFNNIAKLQAELCQNLPLLKVLNLQHNELHMLPDNVFIYCTNLRELNLGFNLIAMQNDFFQTLKNLKTLDISHNALRSTKLGSQQQLESLQELVMSQNKIVALKKEDFLFLRNSSLKILDLSSNPLTEFHPGCFHAIGDIFGLNLNKVHLGTNGTEKLCLELSNTSIQNLSLSQVQLSRISNMTFNGMQRTNLTILDLSNSGLSVIENGSFVWFKNLQTLNLENNKIAHLFSRSLDGLNSVNYLNLRNSINKKIDDFAFQSLKHLECLIMDENTFPEITPKTFTGLENLKNLSLSKCVITLGSKRIITNKTFSSLANSPLQFLNLTRTKITNIQPGAFSWLGELKTLDLEVNEISQEITGHEFQGLSSIETIFLSYNNHLTLTSSSFAFIPGLRKLRLRKVGCSNLDISPSPFHLLKNLTVLDLGNNNIANMREDLFDGLNHLEILDMQHNNLARFWKHANPGGPLLFLEGLQNLHLLDLESNGFDEIPGKVFHGLSNLRSLNLGSNNLNLLPEFVFNDLTSLTYLFLEKNLITSVEKEVFGTVFANLKELDMGSNPFDCTCDSIAWFVNWLKKNKTYIRGLNQYLCNTPPKYHRAVMEHFDTSPCDNAPFLLLYIASTTVTVLLIFVVFVIHFLGWRIKYLWNVSVNRVLGFREIDRSQQQFDYDAYIIHAKKDKNWVFKNFITLEKHNEDNEPIIRFCLEERDFEAGISEFEAIVDSINRSRKTIFVITDHLLKDPWCRRFKVHHAIQQAIEQSRDSIILIFRDDIPDYKLNNALYLRRAMFKSRCILEWPAQKERVIAFYQQLKSALKSSSRVQ